MSVDLTELLERSRIPHMGLDPETVLHSGRRRRLRRRLTAAGATLAVVAAAGLATVLTTGEQSTPTPAATVLTTDMVTAPLDNELWSFDLRSGQVQFGRVVPGTDQVVPLGSVTLVNGQAWLAPKDHPDIVLGVVPRGATHIEDVSAGGFLGNFSGSDGEQLGQGLEVYVRHFEDTKGAVNFRGRVFTDGQGRLHGPGGLLPSAEFGRDSAGGPLTVWLDARTRTYGHSRGESIQPQGQPLTSGVTADRDAVYRAPDSGDRTLVMPQDFGPEEGWVSGVAPAGTTDLRVQFAVGTTVVTPLATRPLGADHVAFAAEYRGPKGKETTLTVLWTNPDGTQGSKVVD